MKATTSTKIINILSRTKNHSSDFEVTEDLLDNLTESNRETILRDLISLQTLNKSNEDIRKYLSSKNKNNGEKNEI